MYLYEYMYNIEIELRALIYCAYERQDKVISARCARSVWIVCSLASRCTLKSAHSLRSFERIKALRARTGEKAKGNGVFFHFIG